jgi:hypothetical protein
LIYGLPEFVKWLDEELPKLVPGRLRATETPQEQLDNLFYRWVSGKRIIYDRMFKDLMPMSDEVWEMKTVDLRIFGWLYKPCVFVAVFGDYADLYKPPNVKASYEAARRRVMQVRDNLDLDEPKFATGVFDDLVHV